MVNTAEKLPKLSITSDQVKKHMNTGKRDTKQDNSKLGGKQAAIAEGAILSKEQVIEALVIAGKMDRDEDEVIEKLKEGKSREETLAEVYEEKYK